MKIANFFLATACLVSGAVQAAAPTPEILVTALRGMQWQVRYDFAQPVDKLEFKFSPDDSRGRTWLPDQGFEIVATDRGEVARDPNRLSRQGGVLPAQIFIHFDGAKWAAAMEKPGFAVSPTAGVS